MRVDGSVGVSAPRDPLQLEPTPDPGSYERFRVVDVGLRRVALVSTAHDRRVCHKADGLGGTRTGDAGGGSNDWSSRDCFTVLDSPENAIALLNCHTNRLVRVRDEGDLGVFVDAVSPANDPNQARQCRWTVVPHPELLCFNPPESARWYSSALRGLNLSMIDTMVSRGRKLRGRDFPGWSADLSSAKSSDEREWLMIDAGVKMHIGGIALQMPGTPLRDNGSMAATATSNGRISGMLDEPLVTKVRVAVSDNAHDWHDVDDGREFAACLGDEPYVDGGAAVEEDAHEGAMLYLRFREPTVIQCRYVRVFPTEWRVIISGFRCALLAAESVDVIKSAMRAITTHAGQGARGLPVAPAEAARRPALSISVGDFVDDLDDSLPLDVGPDSQEADKPHPAPRRRPVRRARPSSAGPATTRPPGPGHLHGILGPAFGSPPKTSRPSILHPRSSSSSGPRTGPA